MIVRYTGPDGERGSFELTDHPITVGRSPEADVVIHDDKASRIHFGFRKDNDGFYARDLKSKNGTYVNGEPIDSVRIDVGDRIRVGSTVFVIREADKEGGTTDVLNAVQEEMQGGKGYNTMLKEIVSTVDEPQKNRKKDT